MPHSFAALLCSKGLVYICERMTSLKIRCSDEWYDYGVSDVAKVPLWQQPSSWLDWVLGCSGEAGAHAGR